ncbi:DNA polymerase [Alkalispirochaeta americana]|uniref:Type-4 uracil-DNA glycosylase n=1 Tax=Alkalispirochaeta americana TaxID=159291 RepID=A0A1N6VMI8_9SPIO|nr:uracil-DNA glycosylase [Alkalispirochaeta americana]SIQ79072.1 DNA polymerase [Alkalispirochaeta americana]
MKRYEALYQITCNAEDLLRGGPRRDHSSLADRVSSLMERMDADDHPVDSGPPTVSGEVRRATPGVVHQNPQNSRISRGQGDLPERRARLAALEAEIRSCSRCALSLGRTRTVVGEGVLDPLVMVVGEGPGRDEDQQGRPFVGKAGQYLDKWLEAIDLSRETNVYITNIVKCRPPENRDPQPGETDACAPWLHEQIALVRPRLILTLGRISLRVLTGSTRGITGLHGSRFCYRDIPLVPTFHPSAVLRNPEWRRPVWEDLKEVRRWLDEVTGQEAPGETGR